MSIDLGSVTPDVSSSENQNRQIRGSWSTTNGNGYNVGSYCYPEDVMTSFDKQHAVVFYINVRSSSKYKSSTFTEVISNPATNAQTITASSLAKATGASMLAAASVGAFKGGLSGTASALNTASVGKRIASLGSVGKGIASLGASTIGGAISGATKAAATIGAVGGAATAMSAAMETPSLYRLKDAITLGVQHAPKASYKMQYDAADMGSIVGGSAAGAGMLDIAKAEIIKGIGAASALGAPEFSKGLLSGAKQAINPFKTVLFQSVDLRHFEFKYKFMPRSKHEADNVRNIVNLFKFHMHPEFANNKVFLTYPSEFQIVFYSGGSENENISKISTCVLTEMDVDWGDDKFMTFADGMPHEINMSLRFMETEMLTKERIQEGY